jgi:hypothetical protein
MNHPETSRTYPDPTIATMRSRPMTTHDALVQARLDEKHSIAHDARNAARSSGLDAAREPREVVARAAPRRGSSLRVRLGRGLVGLGAAIAGEPTSERTRRVA